MKYGLVLVALLIAAGCSDDENTSANNASENNATTNNTTTNNTSTNNTATNNEEPDMGEDVLTINNLNNNPVAEVECFDELKDAWPLNATVSTGTLVVNEANGVFTTTIDASAGGSMASASNPFVYVDLDNRSLVLVDDIAAYSNTEWDVAFKRVVIRTNSSSSGPGDSGVARLEDTSFAAVTEVPAGTTFTTDDTAEAGNCEIAVDSINLPMTAFNFVNLDNPSGSVSWYSYGQNGVEVPAGVIYLVKNAEGTKTYKMEIQSWVSGTYTIRWAEL